MILPPLRPAAGHRRIRPGPFVYRSRTPTPECDLAGAYASGPMNHAGRLPRTTRPRRYELLITPDLDASTFSGEVVIALELKEPTDTIVLHAKGLAVALVELSQGGSPIAADLRIDAETEHLVITAGRPPLAGDAVVDLQF